ncbi:MarR family winged helix-turn-helix transcriptional regulator [Aureimonas sp. D3]|uniref:MarR family winged helix-turn-helix transcriptional regulator n=1 Tax=Aureimonas sp. D3 TaxID=1638164 RepID=UPI0007833E7E|nr:helix-turn-helix domain-containing protein [Aureimonas sp. D3]
MTSETQLAAIMPSDTTTTAWVRLMRAQRIVLAAIEGELKAAGLPPLGWYDVLLELKRTEGGRLRPYEIEQRTLLAQHNLSRLLDRMVAAGLVRREAFMDDGRGRWIMLTDEGRAMQGRMWGIYGPAMQRHVGGKLTEEEASRLAALLSLLYHETN